VAQISQSAEAQASSLQHVNGAVGEMEQMTQQNAAMVEESTAAARNLADESDQLAGLVSRFRVSNDAPAVPQSAMQSAPARQPRRRAA
jgi:methyl-accepting chemotaxis protein